MSDDSDDSNELDDEDEEKRYAIVMYGEYRMLEKDTYLHVENANMMRFISAVASSILFGGFDVRFRSTNLFRLIDLFQPRRHRL